MIQLIDMLVTISNFVFTLVPKLVHFSFIYIYIYLSPLDLGDIFAEVGEIQPAVPPKNSASRSTPTPGNTMSIPRPASRPRPEVRVLISLKFISNKLFLL